VRTKVFDKRLSEVVTIIGKNIERMRGGMSQEDLARKAGIGRTTIHNIEAGKRIIRLENLVKIADVLGVKPEDLFISDFDRGEISYRGKLVLEQIGKLLGMKKSS
jgi:transcriptional regulator with XRE-family HTH domain